MTSRESPHCVAADLSSHDRRLADDQCLLSEDVSFDIAVDLHGLIEIQLAPHAAFLPEILVLPRLPVLLDSVEVFIFVDPFSSEILRLPSR